jgi:hypothetical protein
MFLLTLAGLLGASAVIGYGGYRVLRTTKRRWIGVAFSLVVGLLTLMAGGIALLTIGEKPATDERIGDARQLSTTLRRSRPRPSGALPPPTSSPISIGRSGDESVVAPPLEDALGVVALSAPSSVGLREDFTISLSITSERSMPVESREVPLLGPSSAELRTLDACGAPTATSMLKACASADGGTFEVAWDITPTEIGEMVFTLRVPADLMPHYGVDAWVATRQLQRLYGSTYSQEASNNDPIVSQEGVSIDLRQQQIRIPIRVVATLGVSRAVYNTLAVIGTFLSALLGSGWLWQALAWWRARVKAQEPHPSAT